MRALGRDQEMCLCVRCGVRLNLQHSEAECLSVTMLKRLVMSIGYMNTGSGHSRHAHAHRWSRRPNTHTYARLLYSAHLHHTTHRLFQCLSSLATEPDTERTSVCWRIALLVASVVTLPLRTKHSLGTSCSVCVWIGAGKGVTGGGDGMPSILFVQCAPLPLHVHGKRVGSLQMHRLLRCTTNTMARAE